MPQIIPWNLYSKPIRGSNIANVVLVAGSFTTDAFGNVASVSGLTPGLSVSGTNLASGVYSVYFGDGPNVNQVAGTASGAISQSTNTYLAGGAPTVGASFQRVLYLSAETCTDTQGLGALAAYPQVDMWQATMRDGLAASGQIQFLTNTLHPLTYSGLQLNAPFNGSGIMAPGVASNRTVQMLAALWIHKEVS